MSTLAQRCLDAQVEFLAAEGELDRAIEQYGRFGSDWECTFDYHDASLELYKPGYTFTEEDAAFLLGLGFHRCWLHSHDRETCTRKPNCDAIYRYWIE